MLSFEDSGNKADDSVSSELILWHAAAPKNIHETLIWLSDCILDRGGSDLCAGELMMTRQMGC